MTLERVGTAIEAPRGDDLWVRAPGVDLLGEYQGGGWTDPHYLIRRGDGQFAKVTGLLYALLEETQTPRTARDLHERGLAERPGADELSLADVETMLRDQLAPAGMVQISGTGVPAPAPKANPILALGLRGTIVPAGVVRVLARPFALFFYRPVIVAVPVALVIGDIWLIRNGSVLAGLDRLIAEPILALLLALTGLVLSLLHEFGHAAGCHFSGARPGRIGFGVFIVWPALFTDVTDAYRLPRAGRLRTDLGGVYFSVLGILLVLGAYALTGFEVLVLMLLVLHVQALQQLMPFVRTDGYYLLGDVVGVPNPFASVVPVLKSALPGRPVDPKIAGFRPATRRIITGWVLMVVPFLAIGLSITIWMLPRAVPRWIDSAGGRMDEIQAAVGAGEIWGGLYAGLSFLILLIPLAGGAIVIFRVGRALLRLVRRRVAARTLQTTSGDLRESTSSCPAGDRGCRGSSAGAGCAGECLVVAAAGRHSQNSGHRVPEQPGGRRRGDEGRLP